MSQGGSAPGGLCRGKAGVRQGGGRANSGLVLEKAIECGGRGGRLEQGAELFNAALGAFAGGGLGDFQERGNLRDVILLKVMQENDFPFAGTEARECGIQAVEAI